MTTAEVSFSFPMDLKEGDIILVKLKEEEDRLRVFFVSNSGPLQPNGEKHIFGHFDFEKADGIPPEGLDADDIFEMEIIKSTLNLEVIASLAREKHNLQLQLARIENRLRDITK